MNILVTGGAGFIGSHLTDRLVADGHRVRVLDNLANGTMDNLRQASESDRFQFVKGDVVDPEDCNAAVKGMDIVYHLACLGVRHSLHSPFENHKVNAEGTLRVLEASRRNGVRRFFYISSSEIYGSTGEFPIRESTLPCPNTVYGASKLAGGKYAEAYRKCFGLTTTILRIFNNYGPRAHYEGDSGEVIPRTIVNLIYGKQPVVFGKGDITRDFFYVKDTARALSGLLDLPEADGETVNIGTGVEQTIRQVIERIAVLMKKTDLGIRFDRDRPADVPRLWVDAGKFRKLTAFKPEYSFDAGLNETIGYYLEKSKTADLSEKIIERNWEKAQP